MKKLLSALVLVHLAGGAASAQGFLDVNAINVQSAQDVQTYVYTAPLYQEYTSEAASYPKLPSGPGIDVAGGWISRIGLGIEASVDFAQYRSTVGLGLSVPDPYFFNIPGNASSHTSNQLKRQDIGVNIGAVYLLPLPTDRVALKVFGGPTYFNVQNEMVSDLRFSQAASPLIRLNLVTITNYDWAKVKGSGIGYHAGADVGFFFARHVGVGGLIRYSHGKVSVTDPLSERSVDLNAGKTTLGGGLRLRF